MGRRARGDGSAYQDKHGQWWAKVPLFDGTTRRARCADRQEAERRRKEFVAERDQGVNLRASQQALRAWLGEWVTDKAQSVRPSTLKFYRRNADYWAGYIGDLALERLQPRDIRRAMRQMAADGLSPRSVAHARSVLSQALDQAVTDGALARNPCAAVEPPNVEPFEAYVISEAEQAALLNVAGSHRLVIVLHLGLALGLRRGEILALRWADIDWAARTLFIRAGKSKAARRLLPVVPRLEAALRAHHANQLEEKRTLGPEWKEHGLIVASERGTPIIPRNLTRLFKRWLARAGLPLHIRIHDLRHTAITELAATADPKSLQAFAGHSDAHTTLDLYAHAVADRIRDAAERRDEPTPKRKGRRTGHTRGRRR